MFGIVLLRTRLRRLGSVGDLLSSILPFTEVNSRSQPVLRECNTICIDLTGLMLCLACLPTNSANPFQNLGMITCSCLSHLVVFSESEYLIQGNMAHPRLISHRQSSEMSM